ncbi:MAG: type IX secretion system sortase PorU [Tannerella sp.]|nr:type IX secretion system sortase PorU [Tannerella sp.]
MNFRKIIILFTHFLIFIPLFAENADFYTSKSVLSDGKWVKIRIKETGFYKLPYSDLRKAGFSDPSKVSVHGYGGFPMEENFSKAIYFDDLPPVAVYRGTDYILFYAKGVVKWTYDKNNKHFVHENNAYSTHGYYFLTDATATNEITQAPPYNGNTAIEAVDTYDDYTVHEIDKVPITTSGRPYSGRELFGENFDIKNTQDFAFSIPGITSDEGIISCRFVAKLQSGPGVVSMSVDGVNLSSNTILQNTEIYVAALSVSPKALWTGEKKENTNINISFNVLHEKSYLDYIRLQFKRKLQPYGTCTFFRNLNILNKNIKFQINNANSPDFLVFDVTEGRTVQQIPTSSEGEKQTFTIAADALLREFALLDLTKQFPLPEIIGEIKNQNLHGLPQTDMVILAPEAFTEQAKRLAEFHRSHDNLTVTVVTPEQVYNEYSSGTPEATAIRRFMKMFYDRKTSEKDAPKFLLLFGDGRFDNRKLTSEWAANTSDNYLLSYQSKETLGEHSYASDDYFGFLHDGQGGDLVAASLDIGIGRFPVNTLTQAQNAVDKVIGYVENSKQGAWKNNLCFVADDGNATDRYSLEHMEQSYALTQYIEKNHPQYVSKKLFFDAFKINYQGGKPSYPDVRANIEKELKNGALIINYTGHSDSESWSEERVITQTDIITAGYANLPLWITASCSFGPFDAITTSAGENVFLNKRSGGIALFTTTRVAWSIPNFEINGYFLENLFKKQNGKHLTLGEVIKNTKNAYTFDFKKLNFILLGDPALTLAFADEYNLNITEINGLPLPEQPVNMKAFEKVTIKGNVTSQNGEQLNDFNGLLSVMVFDSESNLTTLNNNYTSGAFTYKDYPNTIYLGNDSVENGTFSFSFTVPKDISYSDACGKINLYAADAATRNEASGAYKNFTLYGTYDSAEDDTQGPEIRTIYLNTEGFKDGDKVNSTPVFTAIVWDKSGINTSGSGIGHDMTLTIDGNAALSYSLNSYYRTYLEGNENEGIIQFPIPALETGKHVAEFKVWDIQNNSTLSAFAFNVADNYAPTISSLNAAPSPAKDFVNFNISHNMPESLLNIRIEVYDMTAQLQWKHQESGVAEMSNTFTLRWNLANNAGARMRPGIYIYRVVLSANNSQEVSKTGKLIILAQ